MNDTAIKNFCMWARTELMSGVRQRMMEWDISADADPSADAVNGRVLSASEKKQRTDLIRAAKNDGEDALVERAAYTWFNRILAIRFMEANDRLPSGVRVFSSVDGSFAPQVLKDALFVDIEGLDRSRVLELVQDGDDEATFRYLFLAQCDELAACMPDVFERVGSAMELLLPAGLLRQGGMPQRLVDDIPETDWREGVEIVGWMYQYYVSERKDEVFASFKKGKKAERDAIAPATQLFTPNWIVRYLTENSLGRIWVLNNPDSSLPEKMPYFIAPGEDAETEFKKVSSPEEITVVDPACGSGHILVYAFDLLAKMYEEAGYSDRDAARLIVEKNLSGFEIDPRAAAMASFAVTMKACELDSRFLRRGVTPKITVLSRIEFENEERTLLRRVSKNLNLVDVAAHLDECGSLFKPSQKDLDDIAGDLASLAGEGSLFADAAIEKLKRLQAELTPLAARYDVVVANPPYMGSSTLGKWSGKWIKEGFPEAYRDLCTSFIDRGFTLSDDRGYSAMVTMQSWMFLGSYEKLRGKLLRNHTVTSMAHLGTRAFGAIAGEVVSTTATVFANKKYDSPGTYLRLVDMGSEQEKAAGYLEALANPDCEWLYSCDASGFMLIPGCPVAYWTTEHEVSAFRRGQQLKSISKPHAGISTGDNDRFLRYWHEVNNKAIGVKFHPHVKGGDFRKWFGNRDYVLWYDRDGIDAMKKCAGFRHDGASFYFRPMISWTKISSGAFHIRYFEEGFTFDSAAPAFIDLDKTSLLYVLSLLNSSISSRFLSYLNPTLNYPPGPVSQIPVIKGECRRKDVITLAEACIADAMSDWGAFESSSSFSKHPLV